MTGPPIRDAATLIIVDDSGTVPRVLMGRRRADQVFLPNVFVFPGGRCDTQDEAAPSADELAPAEAELLRLQLDGSRLPASHGRALALAAVRETFEETGYVAGTARQGALKPASEVSVALGSWQRYLALGVIPKLSTLKFFLRAVTPPARPRRYDTRFFMVNARDIALRTQALDEELSDVGWYGLDDLQMLDVPRITRAVIGELEIAFKTGLAPAQSRVVPFYLEQNNVMRRAELSLHRSLP